MTINQVIEITILRAAIIEIAFSIAESDHEAKNATAGHEIAKCQFQPESAPASAPSSPRSANTQKTMAKMVAST